MNLHHFLIVVWMQNPNFIYKGKDKTEDSVREYDNSFGK